MLNNVSNSSKAVLSTATSRGCFCLEGFDFWLRSADSSLCPFGTTVCIIHARHPTKLISGRSGACVFCLFCLLFAGFGLVLFVWADDDQ